MEERVRQFAKAVRCQNARDRFAVRVYAVMAVVCTFQISSFDIDIEQDVFYAGNSMCILLAVLTAAMTKRFYRSYLVIVPEKEKMFSDTAPVFLSDFMKAHPIPLDLYFRYIAKKILPLRIGITTRKKRYPENRTSDL